MATETLEARAEPSVESRLDELLERINTRGDDPVEGLPPPPKDPEPVMPSPAAGRSSAAQSSPGDALLDQQIDATLAAAAAAPASSAATDTRKPNSSRDAHSALDEQLSALLDDAQAEAQITQSLPKTARPPHAEPEPEPVPDPPPEPVDAHASEGPSINHKVPSAESALSRPEARADTRAKPLLDDGSGVAPPAGDAAMSIDELDDLIAGEEVEGEFETVDAVVQANDPLSAAAADPSEAGADDPLGYTFASVDEVTGAVGLDDEPEPAPAAKPTAERSQPRGAWFAALLQRLWLKLSVMPDVLGYSRVALGWVNLPVYRLPVWVRHTLGLAGLITIFNALALLVYAVIA